ncbi:N-acetylmuramoyl-L-alanine amidase [Pseudonocardia sp. H11422]|uniref:peptidoglycan recognition protein family protein n=1 Tax=Pseudonocardia sp. H11422 TaxID=2835866 RepID=UPI001BDCA4FA|nr:N-acetylmuramoyl-L-alanine amidase [Pseudonocardia sp. H11422]
MSRRNVLLGGLALAGGGLLAGTLDSDRAWAAASPPIIDCAGWGARPNSRVVPIWNQRPVKILVHHTATPNVADFSRGAADRLARGIQNFHMDRRGWLDTGQHFTISRGGFVLEGRHRSLEVLRLGKRQVEGAHCTGQNVVAVGIENEGTYTAADPPAELWNRLREMCAYICSRYGIRPTEIFGHRDFKDTACPGDRLYGMLPRLRTEVAGALGQRLDRAATVKASWPLLRVADRGSEVLAAQYLMRDAGMTGVVPDGRFGRTMADTVRSYQAANGFEEVNGMIGGESWPALARPVQRGEGGDAERAVETLAGRRGAESLPDVITAPVWQKLLGTGGAP